MELNNIVVLSIILFSIFMSTLILTAYVIYRVKKKFNSIGGLEKKVYFNPVPDGIEFEQATIHFEAAGKERNIPKSKPRYRIINKLKPGLSIKRIKIYKPENLLRISKCDFSWLRNLKNQNDSVYFVIKDDSGEILPVTKLQIPIILN
jgi:hypothetical protein